MQTVYRYWAWLVVGAVVLQIAFAGYGAFYVANAVDDNPVDQDKFDDGWGPHLGFGYLVVLLILIFLVIAFAARIGKPRIWRNVGLAGLGIVQILLAWFGEAAPWIGVLHPLNAFVILGLAGSIAWTAPRSSVVAEAAG